jgi:hypothetical protein
VHECLHAHEPVRSEFEQLFRAQRKPVYALVLDRPVCDRTMLGSTVFGNTGVRNTALGNIVSENTVPRNTVLERADRPRGSSHA